MSAGFRFCRQREGGVKNSQNSVDVIYGSPLEGCGRSQLIFPSPSTTERKKVYVCNCARLGTRRCTHPFYCSPIRPGRTRAGMRLRGLEEATLEILPSAKMSGFRFCGVHGTSSRTQGIHQFPGWSCVYPASQRPLAAGGGAISRNSIQGINLGPV